MQIEKSSRANFCKFKSVMDFSGPKPVWIDTRSVSIDTLTDFETEIVLSFLFLSFCSKISLISIVVSLHRIPEKTLKRFEK